MKNFVGLDIGGSKTAFYIESEDGSLLKSGHFTGMNFSTVSFETFTSFFQTLISSIIESDNSYVVFAAVAGLTNAQDKHQLKEKFSQRNIQIEFDSDLAPLIYSVPKNTHFGLLIVGTGSILQLHTSTGIVKLGGWGTELDPFNGGYSFGRAYLMEVIRKLETDPQYKMNMDLKNDLIQMRKGKNVYSEISKYTRELFDLCLKKDTHALAIFYRVFKQLEARVLVAKQYHISQIYTYGGLLNHSFFYSEFSTMMKEHQLIFEHISQPAEKLASQLARSTFNDI